MTTTPDLITSIHAATESKRSELVDHALTHMIDDPERTAIFDLVEGCIAHDCRLPTLGLAQMVAKQHRASERVVCLAFGYAPRVRRDHKTGAIHRDGWVDLVDSNQRSEALLDLTRDDELGAYLVHRWLTDGMGSPAVRVSAFTHRPQQGTPHD